MACTLGTYTATQILSTLVGATAVGRIGSDEISADISENGTESLRDHARADFQAIIDSCEYDMSTALEIDCAKLNYALRWYTIYLYKLLDMRTSAECKGDDRLAASYLSAACKRLYSITDKGECLARALRSLVEISCIDISGYGTDVVTDLECN